MSNFYTEVRIHKKDYAEQRGIKYDINTKFSELQLREINGKSAVESIQIIIAIFAFINLADIGKHFEAK